MSSFVRSRLDLPRFYVEERKWVNFVILYGITILVGLHNLKSLLTVIY